jgi:molybdopterin synthase catalytic subunit
MELEIRLFATLKARVGHDRIRITTPDSATVQTMLDAIVVQYPELAVALPTSLVAVNQNFASLQTEVYPGDEVAIFPPVSGGDDEFPHPTYFCITSDPLDIDVVHAQISAPDVGAIVSFIGSVRGQTEREGMPAETLYLEYEAYTSMAELKMSLIAKEIWERWPAVKGIAIVQRIGRLSVGDVTTFVACAAGHRDQGVFEAARFGIDRLKEIVPVWKKEVGPDRSVWVEGRYFPSQRDN